MPAASMANKLMRALFVALACACWHAPLHAAPACAPVPAAEHKKSAEPIVDWYENFARPYRIPSAAAPLAKSQVEAYIDEAAPVHRRAVLDPLFFESLVQQIASGYARMSDFRGIDSAAAEKIYKSGIGEKVDFSLLCISAKTVRTPDDAFGITLFGVVYDDCQHIGLRGLVFTATLVNGSANGRCLPDQKYAKMFIVPVHAGVNEITFVCGKDRSGCARQ
jgi:hypothetical protein